MTKKADLSKLELALEPVISMNRANEDILIHEGMFFLFRKSLRIELKGRVYFSWLPELQVRFQGIAENYLDDTLKLFDGNKTVQIEIRELNFINDTQFSSLYFSGNELTVRGFINPPIIFGNKNIDIDYVRFEIANMQDILGLPVRTKAGKISMSRLDFSLPEFILIIDCVTDKNIASIDRNEKGGYFLTYTGSLKPNTNKYWNFETINNTLHCFTSFLYFLNGRRYPVILQTGFKEEGIIWRNFTPYITDNFKSVFSWVSTQDLTSLVELWKNYYKLWEDTSDRQCIKTVLHWYVEANSTTAFVDGSIVLIQNALELLFHWIIAENYKYVNDQDAKNISAEAKISFLLSLINVIPDIPVELVNMTKFAKANNFINGPSVFINIRNAIVHPRKQNRDKLSIINSETRSEALNLGLYYVEIILLKHLGYKGFYYNRCKQLYSKYRLADEME